MATGVENYPNITVPAGAYPYGNVKDDPGGTPFNVETNADYIQFFARMLDIANMTANVLPDNLTNGYQYFIALQETINYNVGEIIKLYIGTSYSTTTGYRISGLATRADDGIVFFDGRLYYVTGNAGGACGGGLVDLLNFTVPQSSKDGLLAAEVDCGSAGTGDICDFTALVSINPLRVGSPLAWTSGIATPITVSFTNNKPTVLSYTLSGVLDGYINLSTTNAQQGSRVTLLVDAAGATGIVVNLPGASRVVYTSGSATITSGYIVIILEYAGNDGSASIFTVGYGN
jgi:hypothetical protein